MQAPEPAAFGPYDLGCTTVYASRRDPRFAYCLYVPPDFRTAARAPELVVTVHGSPRTFMDFRDRFQSLGADHNAVILSPLFPVGVNGDGNGDGYKQLREPGVHYDELLLDLVDEVTQRYGVQSERFALFGYSGGAQFANRFLLLRPQRLWAAAIAAPGSVTLLDSSRDWWVGTRDVEQRFGRRVDLDALRRVAVQIVVGGADLDTVEITHREGGRHWMAGANGAGATRPQRAAALQASLAAAGVDAVLEVLLGVAHDAVPAIDCARSFLAASLAERRRRQG